MQEIGYTEKLISLEQWSAIVHRYIAWMKQGNDSRSLTQLLPLSVPSAKITDPDGMHDYDYSDPSFEESKYSAQQAHGHDTFSDSNDDKEPAKADAEKLKQKTTKKSSNNQRNRKPAPVDLGLERRAKHYFHNIKKVPSRIAAVVQHDRQDYNKLKHEVDEAALSSIAKRTVDMLISQPYPTELRNYLTSGTEAEANCYAAESQRQVRPKSNLKDLQSGRSVRNIADAFLHSSLGKEMLSSMGSSNARQDLYGEGDLDLSPDQAELRAAEILGEFFVQLCIFTLSSVYLSIYESR